MRLSAELNGEVVSADSRQVYRLMDIGTAKPTVEQRALVPHHLIDLVNPDQQYSLSLFLRQARETIEEILLRGRLPIVAGGTGQYVRALLEGWRVPEMEPDAGTRRELEARVEAEGVEALHRELARTRSRGGRAGGRRKSAPGSSGHWSCTEGRGRRRSQLSKSLGSRPLCWG